jgi:adenosylmethionine-8-amino-7-oxononanoate aminotransferase
MADGPNNEPVPWQQLTGVNVCIAARKHGLLTRPVRDTIVLMPPLAISEAELEQAVTAISSAISEVC